MLNVQSKTMQCSRLFVIVGLLLTVVAVAEDQPDPTPIYLWDRTLDPQSAIPLGPNVVTSAAAGVVVEFRTVNASATIRGMNATSGASLWTFTSHCAHALFITTVGDDISFVVGCTNGFYVHSLVSGGVQVYIEFSAGLMFAPIVELIAPSGGYHVYTALQPKRYLILSLMNASNIHAIQYGSMVYDVALRKLSSMPSMLACPSAAAVFQFYTAPGEQGYAQLCQQQSLVYTLFRANTSTPSWSYTMPAGATVKAGTQFSYASSLANVAFVYATTTATLVLAVFDVVGAQETPLWTINVPMMTTGPTVTALAAFYETIVGVGPSGAFAATAGNITWTTLPASFPVGLFPTAIVNGLFGGVVVLMDSSKAYTLDAGNGTVLKTIAFDNQVGQLFFTSVVPIRWSTTPLDAAMPTVSDATWQLVVASDGYIQLVDVLGVMTVTQVFSVAGQLQTTPAGPLTYLSGLFQNAPLEDVLLLQTTSGLISVSLSFAWTLMDAQYVGQQDAVLFINSGNSGNAAAIDRNGNTLWEHASPFNAQVGAPFGFINNILLDVVGSSAVAAYNTYNGSLLTTRLISNDCRSNASIPSPSLNGFAADASRANAYFAATLPCLFRIENTLTMHTLPLPFTLAATPVIDDDNGVAYLFTPYEVYSISIPLGLTVRKLYTTSSVISGLVPSSSFAAPISLHKGLNPIVFVFTANGITALNVIDFDNTYVWNVPLPNIVTYEFYNNSFYVVSTSNGLCRVSVVISMTAAQRVLWCTRASLLNDPYDTPSISNIVFTADGTLLLAVGSNVWTLNADSGTARWRLSGQIAMADSSCGALLLDEALGLLFVSCSFTVTALDIFQLGHRLFYASFLTNMNLYYFPGTLFAGQTHQSVSGIQIPTMFINRGVTPPPTALTMPPSAETVPPNFVPKPEVPAPLPPYPVPQGGHAEALTIKAVYTGSQAISYGSSASNDNLFVDRIFLTPHVSDATGECVVSQYNAAASHTDWNAPFQSPGCACFTSTSKVVGANASSALFLFTCGPVLYAVNAATGAFLWNTSSTPHQFTSINYVPGAVIGLTASAVLGFLPSSGAALFSVPLNVTNPQITQTFEPVDAQGKSYVVVVGSVGLQVVLVPVSAPSQATTTIVVSPGNGPTQQDKLCSASRGAVQFAVPAESSSETDMFRNMTAAYFACSHNIQINYIAVFRVDLAGSTVLPIANVSMGASTTVNSLQVSRLETASNDPAVQLFLNMDRLVYMIETNTTAAMSKVAWVIGGAVYKPSMGLIQNPTGDNVLLVGSSGADKMIVLAIDAATGMYLWNITVSSPYTFLVGQERFATTFLYNGLLLLGSVGMYALNITTGRLAWAAQTSNQGIVRTLTAFKTAPFAVPLEASDPLVPMFAASYFSTAQAMMVVAMVPAALELSPEHRTAGFFWDAYIDSTSNVLSVVAVDPDGIQVHSFAHNWSYGVKDTAAVYTRMVSVSAGSAGAIPVVFVFESYEIHLYHATTGQLLSTYLRTDACNVATGNPMVAPVAFQVVGPYGLFFDSWCAYRIDATTRSMTAVVLSPAGKLVIGPLTPILVTADNSTLLVNSIPGGVYAVTIATMALAWVNDANQFFVLTGLASIVLPQYNSSVPVTSQQVLGYASEGVVSLSVATGEILWVWLYSRMGIQGLWALDDGTALLAATGNFLIKLSLQVSSDPNTGRLVWESRSPDTVVPTCVHQVPETDLVVYATEVQGLIVGLNHTSGRTQWTTPNTTAAACASIVSVRYPNAPSTRPAPMVLVSSASSQFVVSTVYGTTQYFLNVNANKAVVQQGQVIFSNFNDLYYSALPFPTPLKFPFFIQPNMPPTVPPGYHYTIPTMHGSPTTAPMVTPPQAPSAWVFDPQLGLNRNAVSFSVLAEVAGQDTYFTLTVGTGSGVGDVYALTIVNALTGVQQRHTISFGGQCQGSWMGYLGSSLLGIRCSLMQSLILLDISTTQPRQVYNATGIVPSGSSFSSSLSFLIPDYNFGCVQQGNGTGIVCLDTKQASPTFGHSMYTFSCPNGAVIAANPFYHDSLQRIVLVCLFETAGFSTMFAIDAHSGAPVWNSTFGGGRQFYQVDMSVKQNFGAVLYDTTPPSGSATVALFSIATGATQSPTYTPLASTSFHAADVLAFYFVETVAVPASGVLIMATGGTVFAFDTKTNSSLWTNAVGGGQDIGVALASSLVTSRLQVFVVPQAGSLRVFDALNGSLVASRMYESPQGDTFVSSSPILYGSSTTLVGILFTYQNSLLYWDVATYDVSYFPMLGSGAAVSPLSAAAVYTAATRDLVLDVSSNSGVVIQVVINITGAAAMAGTHFGVVTDSNSGADFVVVSQQQATYLYDAHGAMLWGTLLSYSSQGTSGSFDPAMFALPGNAGTVLVKSLLPRTFAIYNGQNGSTVNTGYLPLCDGDGAGLSKATALSAPDHEHNILYISVQNPCLYSINAATGDVGMVPVPSRSALMTKPLLTQNCVLVIDVYGELMCFPRGAGGVASTTPTWTYPIGYMIDSVNIAPLAAGGFVLVNLGNVLYCVVEATGTLVWQLDLGPRLVFSIGSNDTVWASSWTGIYAIHLDPMAPQRIAWFTSTASIFGATYTTGFTTFVSVPPPVQTSNGNIVVTYGTNIVGLDSARGLKKFVTTAVAMCTALTYSGQSGAPWDEVFVAQCGTVGLYSAVTGLQLSTLGTTNPLKTAMPILLPNSGGVVFALATTTPAGVQILPMPSFIAAIAPTAPALPTAAPSPPFTLPPNFSPQGVFTPIPTLAPGATLPVLSCVLNVEALYADLILCVNKALVVAFDQQNPSHMQCTHLAESTAPCVATWITNVIPSCNAALIYLDNVLTALNHSSAFGYCSNPTKCADGETGAHAVCELVNAASSRTGGATLPPQMQWPEPANQLPQFTIPSNTAGPTTAAPTTTAGPTTTPTPGAPTTTQGPSTATPQTTAAPTASTTTTAAPITSTAAPASTMSPTPTTTESPDTDYMFTCTLPAGKTGPPENFALLVGMEIGLGGDAHIAITQDLPEVISAVHGATRVQSGGLQFWFIFVDEGAIANSHTLRASILQNPIPVAQSLGLQSIVPSVFTMPPQGQAPPASLAPGAVAGIIIAILVAGGIVCLILFKKYRSGSTRYTASAMRSAMIQEDGVAASPSPVGKSTSYGAAGDNLVGSRESQGPIYSAM